MFDKDGSTGKGFRRRSSMRHAWGVGAAVAVLIAAGGLSAAQAAGKVTLRLRAFQGAPVLKAGSEVDVVFYVGNENGGCWQGWSATVATNEATNPDLAVAP
jgi:ABC-type glycerol-3-phosphate transport system substrate-binding protein